MLSVEEAVESVAGRLIAHGTAEMVSLWRTHSGRIEMHSLARNKRPRDNNFLATLDVKPNVLYQNLPSDYFKAKSDGDLFCVCANGFCSAQETWPRILDRTLLAAIEKAVYAVSKQMLREQAQRKYEIGGDVLVDPKHGPWDGHEWSVVAIPCYTHEESTLLSSPPSCNRRRTCDNEDERRNLWLCVGEFHTHPPPVSKAPGIIKPPSDADVFQLSLAACKGIHNCSLVISPEGLYHIVATVQAVDCFKRDHELYYGSSKSLKKTAMQQCRQPIPENLSAEQQFLHPLLRKLAKKYYALMVDTKVQSTEDRVRVYGNFLRDDFHVIQTFQLWRQD